MILIIIKQIKSIIILNSLDKPLQVVNKMKINKNHKNNISHIMSISNRTIDCI